MRTLTMCSIATSVALSMPWVALANDTHATPGPLMAQAASEQVQSGPVIKTLAYQPPRKGAPAPGIRRGGGTRGTNKSAPVISLLAPEHVGLTIQEQPVLYWFTPTKQDQFYEFTLIGDNAEAPTVETKLSSPVLPGVQQIKLSDYKVKLLPGERYLWSVALIVDAEERSANVVAKGAIERIERNQLEHSLMSNLTEATAPVRYAEAGLWYDAVMAISDLIQSNPGNMELRQQRASLLEQAGLTEVAENDLKIRGK